MYDKMCTAMETFLNNAEKELAKVRECKDDIQRLKLDIIDSLNAGRFIHDDHRIVISAPEIIIGNVSKDGTLRNGANSIVIIRSNDISQEAVDNDEKTPGSITNRATLITNTCVDPGVSGGEDVVDSRSRFVVQAEGISLQSEKTQGAFTDVTGALPGEIRLKAENSIMLNASAPLDTAKSRIDDLAAAIEKDKDSLKEAAFSHVKALEESAKRLNELLKAGDGLFKDDESLRTKYQDAKDIHGQLLDERSVFCTTFNDAFKAISQVAEISRKVKKLEDKMKDIEKNGPTESKGTSVNIIAAQTGIYSMDSEGKLLTNNGAGLTVRGKEVVVSSTDETGKMIKDSAVDVLSSKVNIQAVSPTRDGDNENIPATGVVRITSKDVIVESLDYEIKKEGEEWKKTEKALTEGGSITMRAETVDVSTNGTDGLGKGKVRVHSKDIRMKSVDQDEKKKDKALTSGGKFTILAETMGVGVDGDGKQGKYIQLEADRMGVFAGETVGISQGDQSFIQLSKGQLAMSGEKNEIAGATTVCGKTEFGDEVKAGTVQIENLKVNTSLKSPSTSEGVGGPSASKSPSASQEIEKNDELWKDQSEDEK